MKEYEFLEVESIAQKFRQKYGFSETEPINLKSFLLKAGILTVYMQLGDMFSGMCIKSIHGDDVRRAILVNCSHAKCEQHFTICHELYHLFVQERFHHKKDTKIGLFNNRGDNDEYRADLFAAYLLLPWNGVMDMLPEEELGKNKVSILTLTIIEQYFGCSRDILLYRLREKKLIDTSYPISSREEVRRQALQFGHSSALYEKGNCGLVIGNYGAAAFKALEKGIISESSYFSFLEDIGLDVSSMNGFKAD